MSPGRAGGASVGAVRVGDLDLEREGPESRIVLERLYQFYRHDMSAHVDAHLSGEGLFRDRRLRALRESVDAEVWLARLAGEPVGFVLVDHPAGGPSTIGDFFLVRRVRGRGRGRELARWALRRHPGPWAIAFQASNEAAERLWTSVAGDLADGEVRRESRPVPHRPDAPPDQWLLFRVASSGE